MHQHSDVCVCAVAWSHGTGAGNMLRWVLLYAARRRVAAATAVCKHHAHEQHRRNGCAQGSGRHQDRGRDGGVVPGLHSGCGHPGPRARGCHRGTRGHTGPTRHGVVGPGPALAHGAGKAARDSPPQGTHLPGHTGRVAGCAPQGCRPRRPWVAPRHAALPGAGGCSHWSGGVLPRSSSLFKFSPPRTSKELQIRFVSSLFEILLYHTCAG